MQVWHIAIFGYILEPNREIWKYIKKFVQMLWLQNPKKHILFLAIFEFFLLGKSLLSILLLTHSYYPFSQNTNNISKRTKP